MCGATSEQKELQAAQADFYRKGTEQQQQVYGEDQEILQAMQKVYQPILTAGPNQQGYSPAELTDLNTQATEGTAQNYSHAARAVAEADAAAGGGDDFLPSGGDVQRRQQVANASAQQQSTEQLQIKDASYQQGYNQWLNAGQMMGNTAGLLNPTGYSGAATSSGVAAGNTANQIAQENNSWLNAALGAAGGIATGVIAQNPHDIFH